MSGPAPFSFESVAVFGQSFHQVLFTCAVNSRWEELPALNPERMSDFIGRPTKHFFEDSHRVDAHEASIAMDRED